MARRVETKVEAVDNYPTPPWATRALLRCGYMLGRGEVWEPAAGQGHMARILAEDFPHVHVSDKYQYPGLKDSEIEDFLETPTNQTQVDWIITNPPFVHANAFASKAIAIARTGVALLCRLSFLEGKARHDELFQHYPPTHVFVFSERLGMTKDRLDPKATAATAYAWFMWNHALRQGHAGTQLLWLRLGTRKKYERVDDYDDKPYNTAYKWREDHA